jgi:hypothetical protein
MKNVNRRASQRAIKLSQSLILQTTFAVFLISSICIWFHIVRSVHENGGRNDSLSNTRSLQKQRQTIGNENKAKATVAYAWTLAKCEDFQSSTVGMIDAALVLQYSVHQISSRVGKSEYDYQMYVFVHESAEKCAQVFREVGYTVLVFPQPIKVRDIRGSYLRKKVDSEVSIAFFCNYQFYSSSSQIKLVVLRVERIYQIVCLYSSPAPNRSSR